MSEKFLARSFANPDTPPITNYAKFEKKKIEFLEVGNYHGKKILNFSFNFSDQDSARKKGKQIFLKFLPGNFLSVMGEALQYNTSLIIHEQEKKIGMELRHHGCSKIPCRHL